MKLECKKMNRGRSPPGQEWKPVVRGIKGGGIMNERNKAALGCDLLLGSNEANEKALEEEDVIMENDSARAKRQDDDFLLDEEEEDVEKKPSYFDDDDWDWDPVD